MPRRTSWLLIALALAAAFAASWTFHLYFRDNFSTHFPAKAISAAILRSGEIPYWNFFVAGGQPLAGNPNNLTFYPTTLLYLMLPAHVAFNLHFYLHLIAGFLALRAAAVRIGASPSAATVAASSYVLSGAAISTLCFYNLVPAIALIPAAVLSLELLLQEARARNALLLGAMCGLLGLAGEPVIITGAALLLAVLAAGRIRAPHLAMIGMAAAIALLVALPQILAYGEIASEVERGFSRFSATTVLTASFHPQRLLELFTGPFRGLVTDAGPGGFKVNPGEWPLFIPTVVIGPLFLLSLLQLRGVYATRLKLGIAAFLFFGLGAYNPVVRAVVANVEAIRIVRYPEKMVIPMTVAAALLVALLLDRQFSKRAAGLGAILIAALAALAWANLGSVAEGTTLRLLGGTLAALVVLALAGLGWRRTAMAGHFALLAFWMIRTAPVDLAFPYTERPALASLVAGRLYTPPPSGDLRTDVRRHYRARAQLLDPVTGVAHGISYSASRSPEGMHSWLSAVVTERLTAAPLPLQLRYLAMLGTATVFSPAPVADPRLELVLGMSISGRPHFIYRLKDPAAMVQPVERTLEAASIGEALALIEESEFDPLVETIVPRLREPIPAGDVITSQFEAASQSISFLARATRPSAVVINQSYFNAWRATANGAPLRLFPANIDRLGVVVPPGQSVVRLEFGRLRPWISVSWALSALLLALAAAAAIPRSRTSMALPAR